MSININYIDIEASGLHFDSYPIEIALYMHSKYYSWLIKPDRQWTFWCKQAETLHQISRNRLEQYGHSVYTVANAITELAEKTIIDTAASNTDKPILYSDAAKWDEDWLSTLFYAANNYRNTPLPIHIFDLQDRMTKQQLKHFQQEKKRLIQSETFHPHRALEDIKINQCAYQYAVKIDSEPVSTKK